MEKTHKYMIDSFIEGMSSFDTAPSFNFELEPYSPSLPFQKVTESFARVGNIMYQIIDKECDKHETKAYTK